MITSLGLQESELAGVTVTFVRAFSAGARQVWGAVVDGSCGGTTPTRNKSCIIPLAQKDPAASARS